MHTNSIPPPSLSLSPPSPSHSSTANRHFLRTMARVGAGCEQFFDTKTKSRWERKAKGQIAKAFQPALTAVSVEWQQFDEDAPKPVQVCVLVWSSKEHVQC